MRHAGRTVLRYLPVALLAVGIAVHAVRIETVDDDPQSGSAFAMFATVDVARSRRVVATAVGEPPTRLEVPDDLGHLKARLADTPSETTARKLATELLARSWEVHDDEATVGGDTRFGQVRVAVVGLRADEWSLSRHVIVETSASGSQP